MCRRGYRAEVSHFVPAAASARCRSRQGLEEQRRRTRDDRRGHAAVAVAVVVSLFALTGRAPVPPPASLAANPQRFDFGAQQVATASAARTVTLTNTSTRSFVADYDPPAAGAAFLVTGCHPHAYRTDANGNSCALQVRFRPGSPGQQTARIAVFEVDQAGESGASLVTIELTGEAARAAPSPPPPPPRRVDPAPAAPDDAPPAVPRLDVVPTELDFSSPRPARQDVVARNSGTAPVSVGSANVVGRDSGAFRLDADDCTAQPLPAGEQCTITVTRRLFAAASLAAELRITHTAAGSPARVELKRTPAPAATVHAEPDSLDFGSALIGTRSTQPLTLMNVGSVAASNVATGFIGNSDSFELGRNGCVGTLAPQARCTVDVVFAPVKTGSLQSGLLIAGTIVPVRGTGEARGDPPATPAVIR
jgi:hypothetical protein